MERLVQIVDAALADATARSGGWLACKPGCSQCCHGVFAISALDARRLRDGLGALSLTDPDRAQNVRKRALHSVARLRSGFPGDRDSGYLSSSAEAEAVFENFGEDEPCPALDPVTQTCDLYSARPIVCRTFGPPLQTYEGEFAVCELCFVDAPEAEIERCQLDRSIPDLNRQADARHDVETGEGYTTIVAFALTTSDGK